MDNSAERTTSLTESLNSTSDTGTTFKAVILQVLLRPCHTAESCSVINVPQCRYLLKLSIPYQYLGFIHKHPWSCAEQSPSCFQLRSNKTLHCTAPASKEFYRKQASFLLPGRCHGFAQLCFFISGFCHLCSCASPRA